MRMRCDVYGGWAWRCWCVCVVPFYCKWPMTLNSVSHSNSLYFRTIKNVFRMSSLCLRRCGTCRARLGNNVILVRHVFNCFRRARLYLLSLHFQWVIKIGLPASEGSLIDWNVTGEARSECWMSAKQLAHDVCGLSAMRIARIAQCSESFDVNKQTIFGLMYSCYANN